MKKKTAKTPPYRLKANTSYEQKLTQKTVRFKRVEDADLLQAINNDDDVSFNHLVHNLLRMYYGLEKEIDYSNETEEQAAARVREEFADFNLTVKSLHRYHDIQREMMARKLNDGSLVLPDEYFDKKDKIEWVFTDNEADAIFSYSIKVLELTGKTMHLLQSSKIRTIGELVAVNEDDLIKTDSYIDHAIKHELWNVLKASGLRLGMSPSDIMEYQPMYSDLLAKTIITEPHLTEVK